MHTLPISKDSAIQQEGHGPRVSVVIPCYNQGQFLDESIGSVLQQTFTSFEIILVDDGSTDPDTQKYLDDLKTHNIRLIRTKNMGLPSARNNGIREATGTYVLPLDADDKICPTYLERAVEILDRNQDIGIVYCEAVFFGEVNAYWHLPEYALERILVNNIIFPCAMYRKQHWEKVGGYNINMVYGFEDWDFWLSLIDLGLKVYRIPQVLFHYRVRSGSMVQAMNEEKRFFMRLHTIMNHRHLFRNAAEINILIKVAELWIDTGLGFNPRQMISQTILGDEKQLVFEVCSNTRIKKIRFDPINDYAALSITAIYLRDGDGNRFPVPDYESNAIVRGENDGFLLFDTADPQLIFHLPEISFRQIVIEIEYIHTGISAKEYVIAHFRNETAAIRQNIRLNMELQQKLDDMELLVLAREEQISCKNQQLNDKEIHITNIETSLKKIRGSLLWKAAWLVRAGLIQMPGKAVQLIRKGVTAWQQGGTRHLYHQIQHYITKSAEPVPLHPHVAKIGLTQKDYERLIEKNRQEAADLKEIQNEIRSMAYQPLISILVPVYNVNGKWLDRAVSSVKEQFYENWELCLVDDASPKSHIRDRLTRYAQEDPRIHIEFLDTNQGIVKASNAAARLAVGEYIGLLDHDDELSPGALLECVKVLNRDPNAGLIYSDEDKMTTGGIRIEPFFKPDFSPDMIFSQNYICHFCVFKKSLFDAVGGFRNGFDGSQDHDLVLRILEKTDRVHHIPKILYHWRKIPGSTAAVYNAKSYAWEAGRKAIQDILKTRKIDAAVFPGRFQGSYRVKRKLVSNPRVSVIIPFKDRYDLLEQCLMAILERSSYSNLEILGVNNNSQNPKTMGLMARLAEMDSRLRFIYYPNAFNYSAINNHAVFQATGEHVVLMNNDIQVTHPDWTEALLEHSQRRETGAIGARLLYPDNRVQHAGITIGIYGNAGHPHKYFDRNDNGYYARPHVIHNVSAVTGALMMVKKSLYLEVGGLDAENLGVAYNDVDFCLKLREKGYLNVFTPYCEAIHHESASRGYEITPQKNERFQKERLFFETRWKHVLDAGDPYYNTNLSLASEDFAIRL